jgi:hypothetical protein
MEQAKMRRILITLICWTALIAPPAYAGTFPLTDGTKIEGTPESITDNGVVFQLGNGDYSPRLTWDKLTPEALKELMAEAKKESERALLEPMVDNLPQEVAKRKEIVIKPIQTPDRPKQGSGIFALFGSPVGWFIMLVLYAANLFAAYEVCIYRHLPSARVCGLAAIPFFGVLSPIIYGAMPTQVPPPEVLETAPAQEPAATAPEVATPQGTPAPAASRSPALPGRARTQEAAPPAAAVASALPEPVIFQRGDFSFNRRFFETKFAGFFRVIPTEAEKDLVLVFKAARGEFVGRRISRITPNELALEIVKNNVSAEEVIPFTEVTEVQIRHKDTV